MQNALVRGRCRQARYRTIRGRGRMKGRGGKRGKGEGGGGKHQQPESRKVSHPVTSPLIGIAVHRDQPIPKDTGT